MADHELQAITAIKDMEQEGRIAASLIRSGWNVVYRATSPELLIENLDRFKGAVLLLSDDFVEAEKVNFENTILLRGQMHPLGIVGATAPKSDFELCELLRNQRKENTTEQILIPATQSKVIAFGSTQGGSGATTLALNVAEQISLLDMKVLLVDANINSPAIADHFEIHDIRSKARELTSSLSLFEISDVAQLVHLASIAGEFDSIVMDLGLINLHSIKGARISDRTFQWILHSHGRLILTTGSSRKSIDRAVRTAKRAHENAPSIKLNMAITLDRAMSHRDRKRLEGDISESSSCDTVTFSRDHKSVAASHEGGFTFQRSAARSAINREIAQFVKVSLIQE